MTEFTKYTKKIQHLLEMNNKLYQENIKLKTYINELETKVDDLNNEMQEQYNSNCDE